MDNCTRRDAGAGGPLRILHINSSISRRSGVTSVVMNYFRNVDRRRVVFDFYYYATPDETRRAEIESLGGRCFPGRAGKNILRIRKELVTLLQEHPGQYPIVHLHDPVLARFIYPVLHRAGVRSVIVHSHSTAYSDSRVNSIRNQIVCHNMGRYSDVRMACSRSAGDFLFGAGRFEVLANAVDVDRYRFDQCMRDAMRTELGLNGLKVVGHVGRFSEEKNHRFLVAVFEKLLALDPGCHLLLVGDGPLRGTIERLVAERGLSGNVTFLGDRSDVPALYQAMDVLTLPSRFEGLPMVGVESQCAGLPLVCSDRVPQEVSIGNCSFLPLELGAGRWAQRVRDVLPQAGMEALRAQGVEQARSSGFDVAAEAGALSRRYLSLAWGE